MLAGESLRAAGKGGMTNDKWRVTNEDCRMAGLPLLLPLSLPVGLLVPLVCPADGDYCSWSAWHMQRKARALLRSCRLAVETWGVVAVGDLLGLFSGLGYGQERFSFWRLWRL